jgi:hypothetical protein
MTAQGASGQATAGRARGMVRVVHDGKRGEGGRRLARVCKGHAMLWHVGVTGWLLANEGGGDAW